MKKSFYITVFLFIISLQGFAQILDPVHWSFSSKHINGNNFELIFTAKIDNGWHIWSQKEPDGSTPYPTSFSFDTPSGYKLDGNVKETSHSVSEKDADKVTTLKAFENEAIFIQKVSVTGKTATVKGKVSYMKCDANKCLPPEDVDFSFNLSLADKSSATPIVKDTVRPAIVGPAVKDTAHHAALPSTTKAAETTVSQDNADLTKESLWNIIIKGLLAGLASVITPCVYSMLPLTVNFFTKQSTNRKKGISNALFYGFSIILIFGALGFLLYAFGISGESINQLASNGFFNFTLFLLFVVFAISFFGVFEITLPSSWASKSDAIADKGGLIGIFFMALTLVIVSFSCTVPFIGSTLALITRGRALSPIVGMSSYGLGLALPFAIFAFFPKYLHSLPKSGGWLNVIKVSFAFIELALALKFLSNVDLVYNWHLLNRDVFLSLWIIIFLLLGIYLLGFIRFSHDSEMNHVSIPRLFFAILSLSFTMYMIPGLWGAPLKAISAFAPPLTTQEWPKPVSPALNPGTTPIASADTTKRKYDDLFKCPNGLNCYFDYKQGLEAARKAKKPIFLDFTGHVCINCREMEADVWTDPQVLKKMSNDYVVISLYLDDKTTLPENEQYTSPLTSKHVKTIGNKNSDFEATRFNIIAMPYYVLLDNDEKVLTKPRAYNEDVDTYIKFLDDGLAEYKKRMGN